jgi:NitT/TauT family transport system substrate-binding protein
MILPTQRLRLRLNQGDASEARVYYLPHLVAQSRGLFDEAGLDVVFVAAESGGATIRGGQIPMLMLGDADLAVGGPMVTMRMAAEGSGRLVSVCAAVAASPWYLVGATDEAGFDWQHLRGRQVIDLGNIGTASMSFDWLLKQHGLTDHVEVRAGSGDLEADLQTIRENQDLVGFHSLHHLAPAVQAGDLYLLADFADALGPVPWSSYIARPERIAEQHLAFTAFVSAIGRALRWIASERTAAIAELVQPYFADYPPAALLLAIDRFRSTDVVPGSVIIPRASYQAFHAILVDRQWLPQAVPYEDQVDVTLADQSLKEPTS